MIRKGLVENINRYNIGAHLSIKGSIMNTFKQAEDLRIRTFACFTAPSLQYSTSLKIDDCLIKQFKTRSEEMKYKIFSHASYLINIADAKKQDIYKKSIQAVDAELNRCSQLGILGAVIHPGSNSDKPQGIADIIAAINTIFEKYTGPAALLLESSAGQGETLPVTLEDVIAIYQGLSVPAKSGTKLVIDTCHVHAAGYSLSNICDVRRFLDRYDSIVGFDKVGLIHLNDSKKFCGSKVDRHENIGKGTIGVDGFSAFIKDSRTIDISKILETPVQNHLDWKEDLDVLEELLERGDSYFPAQQNSIGA